MGGGGLQLAVKKAKIKFGKFERYGAVENQYDLELDFKVVFLC